MCVNVCILYILYNIDIIDMNNILIHYILFLSGLELLVIFSALIACSNLRFCYLTQPGPLSLYLFPP